MTINEKAFEEKLTEMFERSANSPDDYHRYEGALALYGASVGQDLDEIDQQLAYEHRERVANGHA